MPRGWEGNRRSGVALAMRHGLKWFIHLRAQRPRVGDEHLAYAPAGAWLTLLFLQTHPKLNPILVSSKFHDNEIFYYVEVVKIFEPINLHIFGYLG